MKPAILVRKRLRILTGLQILSVRPRARAPLRAGFEGGILVESGRLPNGNLNIGSKCRVPGFSRRKPLRLADFLEFKTIWVFVKETRRGKGNHAAAHNLRRRAHESPSVDFLRSIWW
jgi:hypothetical protein